MRLALLLGLFLLASCSSGQTGAVCARADSPGACGARCTAGLACPAGLYCGGGRCTADCSANVPCTAEGATCSAEGQCVVIDAGPVRDAAPDSGPRPDVGPRDAACAAQSLTVTRVTPNIVLLVDRSGSMNDDFVNTNADPRDEASRWEAIRDFITAVDGPIARFSGSTRFALSLYSKVTPPCPTLVTVAPQVLNFAAIDREFRMREPQGGTPTGAALTETLRVFQPQLSQTSEPTIVILASDGEPDTCEDGMDVTAGRAASLAAVNQAFASGVRTFVISLGDELSTEHLQDLANAGQGRTAANPAMFYRTNNPTELRAAIEGIVGAEVPCTVDLAGEIDPSMACEGGTVMLGTATLRCDDPNGWRAVDSNTIELRGTACRSLQTTGSQLAASFECNVIVL